jgi:hypothetical protein
MNRKTCVVLLTTLLATVLLNLAPFRLQAQEETDLLLEDVMEEPVVSYLIEAQLYPDRRKLDASQTVSWRNTTSHAVDHLRFHLYYNAFRDLSSTYMQEAKFYKEFNRLSKKEQESIFFGEIKIKSIHKISGGDLTASMKYVSPDDNNPDDRTVMHLDLPEPVQPGQNIRLKFKFILTIPQIFSRTGAEGDFFFMGQWFPKIGVLQSDGQWNCHQFHMNSEFFADFGNYNVTITVPEKYVIGATGNLTKKERNADKTLTYWYEEKSIHDFAWTAYPHFKRITETIRLKGSRFPTTIELLLSPGHSAAADRYLNAIKYALHFFNRQIFPYPYKKLTLVDPPGSGLESAGMEYPTLMTGFYMDMLPASVKLTESTAIHEVAHQYWYGIVGTDEAREAWLDEGITSFFEYEILDMYFKESYSLVDKLFVEINEWQLHRVMASRLQAMSPVAQPSWKFVDYFHYTSNVYSRAAIFLRSIKNLVGKEQMYNFFKYYAQKFRFKHPTTEDFIDAFNSFMNEDYSWAFDQFIRGDGTLDHAVYSLESVKISSNPDIYRNEVVFVRKNGYFPVELVITLENGKEIKSFWKEKEQWKRVRLDDSAPLKQAVIDPLYKVPLDRNFLNNSKVRKPDVSGIRKLAMKIGFFFQNLLANLAL